MPLDSLISGVQVFPEEPSGPTEMNILNRHLYRASTAEDQNKPAITIPFSRFRQVIADVQEQHNLLTTRKRPHDGRDPYERKYKEHIAGVIERLKKPRTGGS